ncbi:MAG: hypothetical protein FJ368_07045 [Pelagibacterales bacterium]|nr:hypothetical protein [Pelagibacterales bacterium]
MEYLFCKNYFLVFSTDQYNHCWRVVTKNLFSPLPAMIDQVVKEMESEGRTGIALIKIQKI